MKIIKKQFLIPLFLVVCGFCSFKYHLIANPSTHQVALLQDWKTAMRQEFLRALTYVQSIVIQGETPEETKDFLTYFNNQVVWLDKALESARALEDPVLNKLKQQKDILENVVRAQKETEIILQDNLVNIIITSPRYAILRLMLLYEINSAMQQDGKGDIAPSILTVLSDDQKQQIVDKILQKEDMRTQDILGMQKETFGLAEKQLQDQLEEALNRLKKAEQETLALEAAHRERLQVLQKEHFDQTEKLLQNKAEEAQALLKKSQQELLRLEEMHKQRLLDLKKEQLEAAEELLQKKAEELQALLKKTVREKSSLKKDYDQVIVTAQEENAKLQAAIVELSTEVNNLKQALIKNKKALAKSEQTLKHTRQELTEFKTYARDQHAKQVGAELKMKLTQELADQRIREYSKKRRAPSPSEKIGGQERARRMALEQELAERIAVKK